MDGGESDKEDDCPSLTGWIDGVRIVDSPILFFVVFHKAFLKELDSIRRFVDESGFNGSSEVAVDIGWRLEFLRVVYSYHSAAEDEVIFPALDVREKNVVPSYSLEHVSIEDNFSSIFNDLSSILSKKDGDASQIFQKLTFSIGTLKAMICQHMKKEEEQVFSLLIQKFRGEEQAQLVWQCMCIIPVVVLEDLLPWMNFRLTSNEKVDFVKCIKLIIPEERLLQEVFVSCLEHGEKFSSEVLHKIQGKDYLYLDGLSSFADVSIQYQPQSCRGGEHNVEDTSPLHSSGNDVLVKGATIWHASLRRDLDQVIEELYQLCSSTYISHLSPIILQLNFVTDILVIYGKSIEKIFYPMLREATKNSSSPSSLLIDEKQIRSLQKVLTLEDQGSTEMRSFLETILQELNTFARKMNEHMSFLENEVFPYICQIRTSEEQLLLIYKSLYIMPLGLLRFTVMWFCAHLSEDQSNSVLKNLNVGCPGISKPFTSLLYEWVRIGSSGKTSTATFRKNLEELFKNKRWYAQILQSTMFAGEPALPNLATKVMKSVATHLSAFVEVKGKDISYSNGEDLNLTFSRMFKSMPRLQNNEPSNICDSSKTLESRPMDHIFYIHKALINNLEYLVSLSPKLAVGSGYLVEFKGNFTFLRNIFKIHSDLEDEIVFPSLELKGSLRNISGSYIIDHKLEVDHFRKMSKLLSKISELSHGGSDMSQLKHYQLCLKLQDSCLAMCKVLSDHIHNEEAEIFNLFRTCFSIEEEEKVVGHMLGKTTAESLQEIILWLASYLTADEHHALMSSWLKVSRNTKFGEWLGEWWEGITRYNISSTLAEKVTSSSSLAGDPLEIVSKYLLKDGTQTQKSDEDSKSFNLDNFHVSYGCQEGSEHLSRNQCGENKEKTNHGSDREDRYHIEENEKLSQEKHPLGLDQEELEAVIRRISRDDSLDSQQKSYIIQNLLTSHWTLKQKMSSKEADDVENDREEFPGQSPSFRDPLKSSFGCQHYSRNCKLLAPCCNKLYTCIRCHDDVADHTVDRKAITKMMCMKCLVVQPIGPQCTTHYCQGFSMGRYFCKICKLFDDERQIYHCPYCNLCRVGKGLGVDYFHCMTCNACMSKSLLIHACREKCFEDNCPICHEYIFTSNSPVKALPCGHLMHSACFQDYTCTHYICPICSKSLGDMQVYFSMLDALLSEEKMPEDYSGQFQVILCNDCEKRGSAPFHWLYHKCTSCGSYNTRLL